MDQIMGLKNIELNLNMTQVLETLINISSGMRDKERLITLITTLSKHEVETYKIEADLREKVMSSVAKFYEQRISDYKQSLKRKKIFSFLRNMEIEKQAVELAYNDTKTFVEILSGKEKLELLRGGRDALQHATEELVELLKSGQNNLDITQLTGRLNHAIQ